MQELDKIKSKDATIGIVGLGYTGFALAEEFGKAGFKIIGYDVIEKKIEMLLNKQSYLPFLPCPCLFSLLDKQLFLPTTDPTHLKKADAIIISVPTPLNAKKEPDLTFISNAGRSLGQILQKNQLIVLQSTSFPGTTEEVLLPILEEVSSLRAGKDFFLAYVPEREDAGNPSAILSHIPRLLSGLTPDCARLAHTLYAHITKSIHPCSSIKIAEAAKAFENSYRLINIAFVDEMKIVFDRMNINCWEVIAAASSKPFGYTAFYPGPGIGGECIPVDPIYLSWKAEQYHIATTMINNALKVNEKMAHHVVEQIIALLREEKKQVKHAHIFIIGVAFKADVGDCRESPALRIMSLLHDKGFRLSYNDPFVPTLASLSLSSEPLTPEVLTNADCVVILTDHSQYNWEWICQYSSSILDTRNACKGVSTKKRELVHL